MTIQELSVIVYAGTLPFHLIIREVEKLNDIPNPLDITHCGIVVNISGAELHKLIDTGKFVNLKKKHYDDLKKDIRYKDDAVRAFVIEAVLPIIRIVPLDQQYINEYHGEMYFRLPKNAKHIRGKDWYDVIGKDYEHHKLDMIAIAKKDASPKEIADLAKTASLFCSELVSIILNRCGITHLVAANVIPEELSSGAGKYDLLAASHYSERKLAKDKK
ncbi:Hypothetical_protein [Hexamita inflata]|uniref:Hypothetical_protein n=1 Tax=Hexamita inflata TaxID=28002 RepID=A0AA86RNE7_9EUKA|nr:Hypothetical protein HINF_LOCUS65653 [Hexamita inflata]